MIVEPRTHRDARRARPYTAFAEVAGAYERGRPGYPDEAVRWLAGDEPRDVVDLGAGTGKLTRSLVALGHRVTAVEPLDEMRAELEAALPECRASPAAPRRSRSRTRPPTSSRRAQAFHWFDHDVALPEIARVLRPGGRLALVWNSRDDRDPWMARLSAIIGNETVEDDDVVPVSTRAASSARSRPRSSRSSRSSTATGSSTSSSRGATARSSRRPSASRSSTAVGALYDETAGAGGVRLAYVTECFRTPMKGAI